MKVIYTSDIHNNRNHLYSLLRIAKEKKADCIIIGGDIIPKSCYESAFEKGVYQAIDAQKTYLETEFIPGFKEARKENPEIKVYLDMANDDFIANRYILEEHDGYLFCLLHMKKHSLTPDMDIIGYMCVPPTPFAIKDWEKPDTKDNPCSTPEARTFGIKSYKGIKTTYLDLYSEDTIERDMKTLSAMVEKPFIFIAHSPPYGTPLDILYDGITHAGSRAIRQFIEKCSEDGRLRVSLHGHIHEAPMISGKISVKVGRAICINPGQLNEFSYFIFTIKKNKIIL